MIKYLGNSYNIMKHYTELPT